MMDMEEENRATETCRVRIFVGGLGEGVTADDLRRLFGTLGSVDGVEIIRTKGRSFAYVDFTPSPADQKSLSKLFSRYNGCLWKGGKLKLEKAKEHYLVRLKREWAEDAKLVGDEPAETSPESDKGVSSKEMPSKESLKTKQLRIFFPKLRKVKLVPFIGTGKHKYSFPKMEVPPLPVHFCDCEEHSSPTGTVRGKQFYNGEPENGGMNDEEINIMNAVMNKLFEKEKISSPMHYEKKQNNSHEPPGDIKPDEYDVDSATDDDDDLIINMETNKKKTALIGREELERILGNQESGLKGARIFEEEPNKNKLEMKKRKNIASDQKKKSLLELEEKNMKKLPDETSPEVQTTELGDDFREPTKVSWSQKSSWRELLGGNGAFNTSHILPNSNSSEEEQGSDSSYAPESPNTETEPSEEEQGSDSSNAPESPNTETEPSEEEQGFNSSYAPDSLNTKTEPMEMEGGDMEKEPSKTEVMEELAETQPTKKNVASEQSGRGAAWRQKRSWTQLVGQNNSFSLSQILPGSTYQKSDTKEPLIDFAIPSYSKHNKDTSSNEHVGDELSLVKTTLEKKHNGLTRPATASNESLGDGFTLVKCSAEENHHVAAGKDTTPAPIIPRKCETEAKETYSAEIKVGETCSFMRSAASLREWAKTKAALNRSLKRKRIEKNER